MLEGLYSAAAGMAAQQQQLDAIGNDLANLSTTGYKSARIAFSDLLYNQVNLAGTATTHGAGASATMIGRSHAEGSLQQTGNPLDLAIEGDGYFQVTGPGGKVALTRDGTFAVDGSGAITNAFGNQLSPPIKLPTGVSPSEVRISSSGVVSAGAKKLGQIQLVTVTSPAHLLGEANGLLSMNAASGTPHPATAATLRQGALEQSNVDVAKAMSLMVTTQRSFQMSSSAIQTENQMMTMANQLRA
jgi:flagellar basal-body rod protein FlgG